MAIIYDEDTQSNDFHYFWIQNGGRGVLIQFRRDLLCALDNQKF